MSILKDSAISDLEKTVLSAFCIQGRARPYTTNDTCVATTIVEISQSPSFTDFHITGEAADIPWGNVEYDLLFRVHHDYYRPTKSATVVNMQFTPDIPDNERLYNGVSPDLCRKLLACIEVAASALGVSELLIHDIPVSGFMPMGPEKRVLLASNGYRWHQQDGTKTFADHPFPGKVAGQWSKQL